MDFEREERQDAVIQGSVGPAKFLTLLAERLRAGSLGRGESGAPTEEVAAPRGSYEVSERAIVCVAGVADQTARKPRFNGT
jgi:hypothetical protein